MRRAVVMSERIDAVSPRVRPVVFSQSMLNNGAAIRGFRCESPPIQQQGQHTIWKGAVVFKNELIGLDELSLWGDGMGLHT